MIPPPGLRWPRSAAPMGWALAVVAVGVGLVWLAGLRGGDYPAHHFRSHLWETYGPTIWNNHWYGGHPTPTYSVLTPPLTTLLGVFPAVAIASVVATIGFSQLTGRFLATSTTWLANIAFAIGVLTNVVVGRVPFGVGLALGVCCLWALAARRPTVAAVLAVLTPLGSPVAAVFLGVAIVGVVADRLSRDGARSWRADRVLGQALLAGVAAGVPLMTLALLFGSKGWFPFRTDQMLVSVAAFAVVGWRVEYRAVRIACAVAAVVTLGVWAIPNPLGGNFLRLAQLIVVPLGITAIASIPRRLYPVFVALGVLGVAWGVEPSVKSALAWSGDESTNEEYYTPLIEQVERRSADGRPLGRIEIPMTSNHWETYFVAKSLPFARGWERQVDLDQNEELYDDDLSVAEYRTWLAENAVRWVAVPDTRIDTGGRAEHRLIERAAMADQPWLEEVWRNENWHLFEVTDYQPIVDTPARLVEQDADELVIATAEATTTTIRFGYSNELTIDGDACLTERDDGWMEAELPGRGTYTVRVAAEEVLPGANDSSAC